MKGAQAPYKTLRLSLIFAAVVSLTVSCITVEGRASPSASRSSYDYKFIVDEDGFTKAMVNYESFETHESSWVFVPKSWGGTPNVISGTILQSSLIDTKEVVGESQYFYQAYKFTYRSSSISHIFNMTIEFSMDTGALIVEPRGIFFSPLIGFQENSNGKAEVFLPSNSKVTDAIALGSKGSYKPSRQTLNYVLFDLRENVVRLQIEFNTSTATPVLLTLKQGVFTFESVKRYRNYASDILSLFSDVYNNFVGLFNVTLESVDIRFFLPEFYTLLSVGGYVPFTGGRLGDININIFFVRAVKGVLEVIALHELVHHFLWKTGLSPMDLLWFHEGTAQYVSIKTAEKLGYEGALYERDKIEQGASQLIKYGENFHYLQEWKPETQPADVATYYIASYYVVSRLAEKYGELDYYRRFFRLIKGIEVKDNNVLAHYLGLAANTSMVPTLRKWGFNVVELHIFATLIEEAGRVVYGVNPAFQPYKFLAELLYKEGLVSLERGEVERANEYFEAAIFMAKLAPLLTLATIGAVLIAILYAFKRYRALPKPEIPTS